MTKQVDEKIREILFWSHTQEGPTDDIIDQTIQKIKSVLMDDSSERLERIENYLEAGFLAANFQHTEQVGRVCANTLLKHPKDLNTIMLVSKLDNDQRIIEPRMRHVNCSIWRHIVAAHGNGLTLKYFEIEPPKKTDLHVSK
jgi:hypothetical protein